MAAEEAIEPARLPWHSLLPWQRDAAQAVLKSRSSLPHALLIHGPRGIGKQAFALNLAQALVCEVETADGLACGVCPGCRYAEAGQHPDLMRLELLTIDPEDGALKLVETINIDRIRSLTDFVQLTSHRRKAKVAVISPAERMNAAAANALLKTLEEPPPETHLILVSDHPGRVAATIVSRCSKLPAPAPTSAQALDWLEAQGVSEARVALAQAAGAPLVALAHADPDIVSERRAWVAALVDPMRLSASALAARIESGGKDLRKQRLAQAVDWLIGWTADLARVVSGDSVRHNPDATDSLRRLGAQVAPIALFRYYRSLLQQRALLAHPLQPRLVAEALLTGYRALF